MCHDGPKRLQFPFWRQLLLSLVLAAIGLGCGPLTRSPADLIIINGKEPESLDPVIINGQADGRIVSSLFEGLTRYHVRTGRPAPGLAASWTISPDGRTYRFQLRPGISWSNGKPIHAEDFVYSWKRVLEPASACEYASILNPVHRALDYHQGRLSDFSQVGVRAITSTELEVTLTNPTPYFLDACCYPTLAVVPREPITQHGDRWLIQPDVPTSGPYRLDSWQLNDRVRLVKNDHYWDVENVKSTTVDILPTSNPSTALNLYTQGQVDIVWDKELIPTELIPLLKNRPDFHTADFLGTYFLRINTTRPPFDDARVRQALGLAIDKKRIVERITQAGEVVAQHLVPPGITKYQSPSADSYNIERARQLMAEAGFSNGQGLPAIDYLFNSSKLNEQIAVEIQSMWAENLGVKTQLRQLEWKSYLQDQSDLNYTVSRSSWIGDYVDPYNFLEVFTTANGNNRTGWSNETFDQLLEQATETTDPAQRMQLLHQAEEHLIREGNPIVPLYFYVSMEYYDTHRIAGIYPNIRAEHPIRSIYRIDPTGSF